jgi:predicted DCC family thiol-disulfide oxidoreductase YuxK
VLPAGRPRAETRRVTDAGATDAPVLLYDGVCGFCNATVRFILRRDRRGTLRFAALQSAFARQVVERHPELAGIDSLVWVEGERIWIRSSAALRAAQYLGGRWRALLLLRAVPRPVRDAFYDLFARHRYRLFGRSDRCVPPPLAWRARFLDPP